VDEDSTWTGDQAVGGGRGTGSLPAAGAMFARHRIEAVIGRGGMGVVYRARNVALDRDRALKVIAPALAADVAFRARFQREARLAASLDHPNVVSVHEAGEEDGLLYLSMQLVDGPDLSRLVEREGRLDAARTAGLVSALASALDAAHARGMVHRDVKPSNVLIEGGGALERVWLADFGITRAREHDERITETGEVVGSVDYAAPEQLEGAPPGPGADIYSLGCVAYFALTGEPPFPRPDRIATLYAHANAPRPRASALAPGVPRAVDAVLARAMASDPGDRFGSAGEMAAAFGRATGEDGRASVPPTLGRPARFRRSGLIAGALLALAGVAVALFALLGGDDAEPGPPPVAAAPRADEPIEVGPKPVGITVGERSVWVAYEGGVRAINPEAGTVIRRPTAIAEPHSVAVGFGSVWVASEADDAVYRVDQGTGLEPQRIAVGDRPADLAVDERWVWVALEGEDRVVRIHPSSNEVAGGAPVGDGPRSLAVDRGVVWSANRGDGTVSRVRARTAEPIGARIPVGRRPNDLAAAGGSVWVVDNLLDTLTRLDSSSGEAVGDPVRVGPEPRGVAVGLGSVWVVTAGDDLLTRIDPERPSEGREAVEVGREPTDLAIGAGSVWTADLGDGTVTRVRP
jgi:DNA-binding beta-propeller fold protein YncE